MNLTAQIAAYEEQKKAKMPSDILDVMNQTTELLVSKHIADKALRIGDKVADFTLPDQNGKAIKLSNLLAKGPIVVSFYRGGWCPYCNLELKAFNALLPDFKAHGAELIAISPQLPDSSLDTVQKNALEFTVLSDVGNKIAEQFGLVFTLDERLKPIYAKLGLDLPKSNGDDSYQLPLPSTYVINQRAEVAYAFVSEDYTQRAEPNDVLNLFKGNLKEINK